MPFLDIAITNPTHCSRRQNHFTARNNNRNILPDTTTASKAWNSNAPAKLGTSTKHPFDNISSSNTVVLPDRTHMISRQYIRTGLHKKIVLVGTARNRRVDKAATIHTLKLPHFGETHATAKPLTKARRKCRLIQAGKHAATCKFILAIGTPIYIPGGLRFCLTRLAPPIINYNWWSTRIGSRQRKLVSSAAFFHALTVLLALIGRMKLLCYTDRNARSFSCRTPAMCNSTHDTSLFYRVRWHRSARPDESKPANIRGRCIRVTAAATRHISTHGNATCNRSRYACCIRICIGESISNSKIHTKSSHGTATTNKCSRTRKAMKMRRIVN